MTVGKFMLGAYLILFGIFAYLVYAGVPILYALCIFIYPTALFAAYIILACKLYGTKGEVMRNHEDGICPLCGKEIDYVGAYEHDDDGATLDWQCPSCGASGKAGYTFVFDKHYCIRDGSGNMVE